MEKMKKQKFEESKRIVWICDNLMEEFSEK